MSMMEKLLAEDGINLPSKGGAEKLIRCFSPHHDDKTASMSVNVAKDRYICFGCGLQGGPYTYLANVRGVGKQAALQTLKNMGAPEEFVRAEFDQAREKERKNKPATETNTRDTENTKKKQH